MEYSGSIVYSFWLAQILPSSVSPTRVGGQPGQRRGSEGAITDPKGEVGTHPDRPARDKKVGNSLLIKNS